MKVLLAVLPYFQNTSFTIAHLGNACISAYLKKHEPQLEVKTLDLRTFADLKNSWTAKDLPQITYTKLYVSDIYDLPLIASLITNFYEKNSFVPAKEVVTKWSLERGFYPDYIFNKLEETYNIALKYKDYFANYDFVGFSLYTTNFYLSVLMSLIIRKFFPKIKIVFGGPQITQGKTTRELLLKNQVADFVIIGEGEEPFLQLLKNYTNPTELEKIIGLKNLSNIDKLDTFSQTCDLENLPTPDYDDIDFSLFNPQAIPIYSNRGCPFRCHFCSEHSLFGKKFKRRSPEKVIEDMKILSQKYKINEFTIADSLINSSDKWLEDFVSLLSKEKEQFFWGGYFRAEMKTELIEKMSKVGLKSAILGVESFSQTTLDNMNKRKLKIETIDTIRDLVENNIHAFINIFVGYPSETEEPFDETKTITEQLFKEAKYKGKNHYYHITTRNFQLRPFSNIYDEYSKFGLEVESWKNYYDEGFFNKTFKEIFEQTLCSFIINDLPLSKIQQRMLIMNDLKNRKFK